jgi:ribosomal protein L35
MKKTNKSFAKRLKVTKNKKVIARRPGQNHFNAKESRRSQMADKRSSNLVDRLSKKEINHFITNL